MRKTFAGLKRRMWCVEKSGVGLWSRWRMISPLLILKINVSVCVPVDHRLCVCLCVSVFEQCC